MQINTTTTYKPWRRL